MPYANIRPTFTAARAGTKNEIPLNWQDQQRKSPDVPLTANDISTFLKTMGKRSAWPHSKDSSVRQHGCATA